jgi:hypothetical protein
MRRKLAAHPLFWIKKSSLDEQHPTNQRARIPIEAPAAIVDVDSVLFKQRFDLMLPLTLCHTGYEVRNRPS